METISEDAWDKDIVKRTFKLTNTKIVSNNYYVICVDYLNYYAQDDDARTITQLQYMEWSQNTCPDGSALVIDMIEVLERVQRKTGNGPITVHCRYIVSSLCSVYIAFDYCRVVMVLDVLEPSVH